MNFLYLCDRLGECRSQKYGTCNNAECFHTSNEKHAKYKTMARVCVYTGKDNCLIETTGSCRHPSDKCDYRFGVYIHDPNNETGEEKLFCSVENCIREGGADDEKNL